MRVFIYYIVNISLVGLLCVYLAHVQYIVSKIVMRVLCAIYC